ncbi:hypothetical protein C5167_033154 [Papaver somniferum]|uniref:Ubiquitin carboxyl-terminal hydrolase n=1 Tax=Papaver somniferum TaxID=3469 RepID=A0A4Y7K7N4_PAPSO|nr:hypothetical protein C5167_033154 [Papaver somniferum]
MTRATRNKKNKRSKSEEQAETTSEICKREYVLLMRKTGLWQKMADDLRNLGPNPSQDLRDDNWPAGLTNLGAKCYASSILQCLFMNSSFRDGVFAVKPELLKQCPVLDQLAKLFAQLHSSDNTFIDSAPFVKTLELNNGVQQDSHEFLTLLLSLLERFLSRSKVSNARTIVLHLFRGRVSNVTRCSKCGQDSEASSTMEDFFDIELNIKDFKSLDTSLEDYLSVETLCGDNQYFCESCGILVDTTRWIKLHALPDVLNFQLKRCDFLTTVKRITSEFSDPEELQMKQRLYEPSQSELTYNLSAILVHKGSSVNSGHYVSIIKDEHTGEWWEFDDESVSKLGSHPFGEGSSSSTAKPMNIVCHGKTFTSANAYMLIYHRQSTTRRKDKAIEDTERSTEPVPQHDKKSLPVHLFEEIKSLNESYATTCQNYQQEKESERTRVTERREEVNSILSEAPAPSLEDPYFWIPTDWLHQWADNIAPHVLDNTSIQCSHGGVTTSKVFSIKRLSEGARTRLLSKYGGGPTLSNGDLCIDCWRGYVTASAKTVSSPAGPDPLEGVIDSLTCISVLLVRGKVEAPKSVLDASCVVSEPHRHTSKCSRKNSYGNSVNLKVSSSMSIYRLKMMIWESFWAVKENQMLHKGRWLIEEESATLDDMNIFPGDVLWFRDTELHENRDIADEISLENSKVRQNEEGFRGTLLIAMQIL